MTGQAGQANSLAAVRRKITGMNPRRMTGLVAVLVTFAPSAAFCTKPPDFGPNLFVFNPSMPAAAIQQQIDKVYAIQQHSEFGTGRYALLFLPGDYNVDVPIGFYTEVVGLGPTPDDVRITGNVPGE